MFKKFIAKLTYLFNKRYSYYVVYQYIYRGEQGNGYRVIKNKNPNLNLNHPITLLDILKQEIADQYDWDYENIYIIITNYWRFKNE